MGGLSNKGPNRAEKLVRCWLKCILKKGYSSDHLMVLGRIEPKACRVRVDPCPRSAEGHCNTHRITELELGHRERSCYGSLVCNSRSGTCKVESDSSLPFFQPGLCFSSRQKVCIDSPDFSFLTHSAAYFRCVWCMSRPFPSANEQLASRPQK